MAVVRWQVAGGRWQVASGENHYRVAGKGVRGAIFSIFYVLIKKLYILIETVGFLAALEAKLS